MFLNTMKFEIFPIDKEAQTHNIGIAASGAGR